MIQKTEILESLRNKRLYGDEKGNGKIAEKGKYLIDEDIKISHKCCDVLKKNPAKSYEHRTGLAPIIGTMAGESRLRENSWLRNGCNAFDGKRPKSNPLASWNEEDIWAYIKKNSLDYAQPYKDGEERTGCMYCLFGCQFNDNDGAMRFDRMKEKYPLHYKAAEFWGIIKALEILKRVDK